MTSSATPAKIERNMLVSLVDESGQPKSPRSIVYNELSKLADRVAKTSMIPKEFRGRPDEILAVMAYGDELGLSPFNSLRSIHFIEGVPVASAQLVRALILSRGHVLQWREAKDDRVTLYGRRRDTGAHATVSWSMADAKRAKLTERGPQSNWAKYPRQMLAARASTELARMLFADLLQGISYTADELGVVGPFDAIDVNWEPTADVVDVETGEIMAADTRFAPEADPDDPTAHADEGDLDEGRPFTEDEP